MSIEETVNWSHCSFVETRPGVQSGDPVLRDTRMPVSAIVDNFDYGLNAKEIAEQFQMPLEQIEAVLVYAQDHRLAHPVR